MNKRLSLFSVAAFGAAAYLAGSAAAWAQLSAQDDAAQMVYTNGWKNGTNGGFGFDPWVLQNNDGQNGGFAGTYIGQSGALIDTSFKSFGMYGNSGSYNYSIAYRGFSNSLTPGVVFKLKMKNNGIPGGGAVGFSLRNGNTPITPTGPATTDVSTLAASSRMSFYFSGGASSYYLDDATSPLQTGIPWRDTGLTFEFGLLTADTYNLIVLSADGSVVVTNLGGTLKGSGTLDSFACYALNPGSPSAGGDLFFNQFSIASAASFAPRIVNLQPANGAFYIPTASSITFDAISDFSYINTNSVSVSLNGVNVPGLGFTGTSNNWAVTASPALSGNQIYNGSIVVTDANGASTTNAFSFNTWLPTNPFIEAEDYNYQSGLFKLNPPPYRNDMYGAYAGLLGSNGVDYLEYDQTGTNHPNFYRTNDLPQVEISGDVDHAAYSPLYTNYNLGFINRYEWENYTRVMSNTTYAVYARMAGMIGTPTMLLERLANSTATTTNQPRTPLGSFVCPNTGGAQNYTFVQLKDFFSNPVEVNFPGTNTFRSTSLADDGSFNFDYLIFVPSTNTATLRPYISSGFPYPSAGPVMPDQSISFTIANRQTAITSVRLFLNGVEVSGGLVFSNTAAGTLANYASATLLPAGTNTAQAILGDSLGSQTNQWQFTVVTLPVLPSGYAQPLSLGVTPGFAVQIAKATNIASSVLFPTTIARVLDHLAGRITDPVFHLPYPNDAAGPFGDGFYVETWAINYDITGTPQGAYTFGFKTNFPYVPACLPLPNGTNSFISLSADMLLHLTAGLYTFAVRSDDGFMLAAGPTPGSTNLILGLFDSISGRANNDASNPSQFSFIVQTEGLYPMRLLYDQGQFGGNIEFYSVNGGTPVLINDPANPIKAYVPPVILTSPAHTGTTASFSFLTLPSHKYNVLFKNALTDLVWQTNMVITGTGAVTNVIDSTATGPSRFYRVQAQ